MRCAFRLILLSCLFLFVAGPASVALAAQRAAGPTAVASQRGETPEATAVRFGAALVARDWTAVAALMHPSALARLRQMIAPSVAKDRTGEASRSIFGTTEATEVAKLSDEEVFIKVFTFLSGFGPEMQNAMAPIDMVPLGHVIEGADVHVLYRAKSRVQGVEIERVSTMSLRRDGPAWRALLLGEMEALGAALKAQAGQ